MKIQFGQYLLQWNYVAIPIVTQVLKVIKP